MVTDGLGANGLRWLNTVCGLSVVTCVAVKHGGEKPVVHGRLFLKTYSIKFCDIWQDFYDYRVLNNENFNMEVKQTNFVTHLTITVRLYY